VGEVSHAQGDAWDRGVMVTLWRGGGFRGAFGFGVVVEVYG